MTTRIAFLRAVNLGKRTVRMARLVELFERFGYENVWTHVNSGNVVFDAKGSAAAIERKIETALEADLGFEVTTFVRTAAELGRIVGAAPFEVADADTYFVTFLKSAPGSATTRTLEALSNDFDTLVVKGKDVHWRMRGKSTESRLKSKDWRIVGEHSTSRNMNMLRKLDAKVASRAPAGGP
jgi:uncharacterized protein (DUF1697 family)